jgi:putative flippase GtrA
MSLATLTRLGLPERHLRPPERTAGWLRQLLRFAVVGGAASVVQLALYAFLADTIGAQPANVASWLVSTLVATEAHRRYSFGTAGANAESDHVAGVVTSLLTLLLSGATLAALGDPAGPAGLAALVAVNGVVGGLRFVVLRWWLVGRRGRREDHPATPSPGRSVVDG